MRALLPFVVSPGGAQLDRDLSHEALRSHARGRSYHEPPFDLAELYDLCGRANETVRNQRFRNGFAVVWLGAVPEGADAATVDFTPADAEGLLAAVFLSVDPGGAASLVLWLDGCVCASCSDDGLRAAHAALVAFDMAEDDFRQLKGAATKNKEWSATRAAAAVATIARAWCAGVSAVEAVESLAPADSFVVQHDGVAKCAEAAMADALRSMAHESPAEPPPRPPAEAPQAAAQEETPTLFTQSFNRTLRIFI